MRVSKVVLPLIGAAALVFLASSPSQGQEDPPPEFPLYNHRPYLQSITSTSVTIVTQSKEKLAAKMRWGLDPVMDRSLEEQEPLHDHVFRLEGLLPATTYRYEVTHTGVTVLPDGVFRTLPQPGADITVAAIGDSGTLSEAQLEIAGMLDVLDPDLLLHTGDIVYPYGSPSNYHEKFLTVYRDLLMRTCVYPVLGNHDCQRGMEYYLYMFHLPANNPAGDESYYSFDAGDAHFAALNSCEYEIPEEQVLWLDEDLGRSALPWKIVFFHHAPYSNGAHGGTIDVRRAVLPVIEKHRVDLVLSGHDHVYERSYPLLGGQIRDGFQEPDYVAPRGTIFVVTGGGGAILYDYYPSPDAHLSAVFHSKHNFLKLRITPAAIEGTAVGLEDEVLDRFTIRKASDVRPFAFVRGDVNEDGEINLSDAVATLGSLFLGQGRACSAAADVDGSGEILLTDAVVLLTHLFGGGPPPVAPFPGCGTVAAADDAGCIRRCEV